MAEDKKSKVEAEPQTEPSKAPVEPKPIASIIGAPGSIFNINGDFGRVGVLTIGGQAIVPTRWDERGLRGLLPTDASGEVKIVNGDGEVWTGHYPAKA